MRHDDPIYKLIDDYLGHKLSDKESLEFEQRINEDKNLKEEVFNRKVANELIVEDRYFEIAKAIRNTPISNPPSVTSWIKKILGIGSVIPVVVVLIYLFNNSEKEKSQPALVKVDLSKEMIEDKKAVSGIENEATPEKNVQVNPKITTKKGTDYNKTVLPKTEGSSDSSYSIEIPIDEGNEIGLNSYSFHPAKGEFWTIPSKNKKHVSVKIFNNAGKEVYHTVIHNEGLTKWNGLTNDGAKLEAGRYTYLLDFENGEVEHGNVSIVK